MKTRQAFSQLLNDSHELVELSDNLFRFSSETIPQSQQQTAKVFSDKWNLYTYDSLEFQKMVENQRRWYLELYGFSSEKALGEYLQECRYVLDAGSGTCYKAAWFAELSPSTVVIAADISDAILNASQYYKKIGNLFFVQCDISSMPFWNKGVFDYVSCDQVIHHTADPFRTFQELVRLTAENRELAVYVYRKKALPRELLDEYFRDFSKTLSHEDLMSLSSQVTELGKILSSLDVELDFPSIPLLGIEGGQMTPQRFLYWNFMKCYWNDEQGEHNSLMTNYDWYSPSQAFRYSEKEFRGWALSEQLGISHFHKEHACYSGRFMKKRDSL